MSYHALAENVKMERKNINLFFEKLCLNSVMTCKVEYFYYNNVPEPLISRTDWIPLGMFSISDKNGDLTEFVPSSLTKW